MTKSRTVPFIIWGGNKNLDVKLNNSHLTSNEIRHMVSWAKKWGDAPRYSSFLERGGISWLDIPVPDSMYRLHLRPFFIREGNERPSFYFLGIFINQDTVSLFGDYESILNKIQLLSFNNLLNLDSDNLLFKQNDAAKISQTKKSNITEIAGHVLKGTYSNVVNRLSSALNNLHEGWFDKLAIACNPPDAYPEVNTLLITDDFYYQGIRVIKDEPLLEEPLPPRKPLPVKQEDAIKGADNHSHRRNLLIKPLMLAASIALAASMLYAYNEYHHKTLTSITTQEEDVMKYTKLEKFFSNYPKHITVVTLSFSQIETVIGDKLPPSSNQRPWWENPDDYKYRSQAKAWLDAGFKVSDVDLSNEWVEFSRNNIVKKSKED